MTRLVAALAAFCLSLLPATVPAQAEAPHPGHYYLALGDSLAYGVTADGVPADPRCSSLSAPGYVCIFYRYLRRINPGLQIKNLAVPGADSCVLDYGFGGASPCKDPLLSQPVGSQLDQAVVFLRQHPGQVSPITLDIGGNDLLPLLRTGVNHPAQAAEQLPGVLLRYRGNLDVALSRIRAAAPKARIILPTQYNPLGGIGSPPLPAGVPQLSKVAVETALDGVMRVEAARRGATIAEVAKAFDAHPGGAVSLTYLLPSVATGDVSKINIHPTPQGYKVYAGAVIRASGYVAPLSTTRP